MSYYSLAIYFWSILAFIGVLVSVFGLLASDRTGGRGQGTRSRPSFHHHSAPSHPGY